MFSKIRLGTQIIGLACLMGGATALLVGYAVVKMQSVSSNLEHTGQVVMPLAASLAQLGRIKEAKVEASQFLAAHPHFSIEHWANRQGFQREADRQRLVEGYLKAGLPE